MPAGQVTTYTATEPQKRVVTDRILMADPMSIAGINALGIDAGNKFAFVNVPGKKYEWLEDSYSPRSDTVNGTHLTSDSTATQFTVSNGAYFQPGDVILIDSEYMWVSAVSSNTLTATRAYGGTQATHDNSSTVYIVGRNRLEGDSADDSYTTVPTTGYNYSSILQKSIEISRSNALLQRYGIPDVVEREIDKAMDELLMQLNLMIYHGQRKEGSTSTPRSFGGLETFISTNATDASSAALTQKMIEDELQDCWDYGGQPDLLICGAWAKRKIADFYAGYVRTERSETMGGITIDRILMPLGIEVDVVVDRHCPADTIYVLDRRFVGLLTIDVVVDRHCPADTIYVLDRRFVGLLTIDPFFEEALGKSKDTAYYGQVVGEYGLVCSFEKAHSYLYGFSTSS